MTEPISRQLDYAPPRSIVSRVLGRRWLIGVAVVVAVAIAVAFWGKPAVRRYQRWSHDRRMIAMNRQAWVYTARADRVVYDEDPQRTVTLLRGDSAYLSIRCIGGLSPSIKPPPWGAPVNYVPPLWANYSFMASLPANGAFANALVFMHGRTTLTGQERLVTVAMSNHMRLMDDGQWGISRRLCAYAIPRDGPDRPDSRLHGVMNIHGGGKLFGPSGPTLLDPAEPYTAPFPLRIFAGQPDPDDPARFTIPYELRGHRGTITGVVHDIDVIELIPDIGTHEKKYLVESSWTPTLTPAATGPATAPGP